MGRASEILIPSRFLITLGHFIVVILAFYAKDANVAAGLSNSPSSSSVSAANASLQAALGLSIVCISLNLLSLLYGATLFMDRLNLTHCVLHFFGGVLSAWFVVDMWGYLSFWWIWGLFSLIPALLEGIAVFGSVCLRLR